MPTGEQLDRILESAIEFRLLTGDCLGSEHDGSTASNFPPDFKLNGKIIGEIVINTETKMPNILYGKNPT